MGDDAAERAFLVTHKRFAEINAVLEAGQQYLPQGNTAHRAMLCHASAPETRWRISSIEREQHFHPFGDETDAFCRLAASAREHFELRCWQAFMQREAAGRIDMHAITLHTVGAGSVAFIDSGTNAGFSQALRQGEAANSAPNDDDLEGRLYRVANGAAI